MKKQRSIDMIKSENFFDELVLSDNELLVLKGGINTDKIEGINCGDGCGIGCGSNCGYGCTGC